MIEQGVVIKNKGKYSEVRIERNSACGSCGKCGMTEKQKHADFFVENACNAVVGDIVELDIPEGNSGKTGICGVYNSAYSVFDTVVLIGSFKWKRMAYYNFVFCRFGRRICNDCFD